MRGLLQSFHWDPWWPLILFAYHYPTAPIIFTRMPVTATNIHKGPPVRLLPYLMKIHYGRRYL